MKYILLEQDEHGIRRVVGTAHGMEVGADEVRLSSFSRQANIDPPPTRGPIYASKSPTPPEVVRGPAKSEPARMVDGTGRIITIQISVRPQH